jgi:hypothetical protein
MTKFTIDLFCVCDDWKESAPQIKSAQHLAVWHNMFYTGQPFRFCPWCGLTLNAGDSATPAQVEGSGDNPPSA